MLECSASLTEIDYFDVMLVVRMLSIIDYFTVMVGVSMFSTVDY